MYIRIYRTMYMRHGEWPRDSRRDTDGEERRERSRAQRSRAESERKFSGTFKPCRAFPSRGLPEGVSEEFLRWKMRSGGGGGDGKPAFPLRTHPGPGRGSGITSGGPAQSGYGGWLRVRLFKCVSMGESACAQVTV